MLLEIITPDLKVFEGEAVSVQLPGSDGLFEILNNHAPMIAALGKGKMAIRTGKEEKKVFVEGGVVEVLNNKVTVLAQKAVV
jgi:F-type H+-transporting ATPase subunit epsilon